jgi:hypothetical protein
MFRRAYMLEDVEPETAKNIYRKIIQITPQESKYHRKALLRLQ